MAHTAQIKFVEEVKKMFPQFFEHKRVLDVGSLDINGSNRIHFRKCDYTGIDLGNGRGVDVVCRAHEWNADPYDVVISTECLEHDEWWEKSLPNMIRLLKPGGILIITCASPSRPEHGTLRVHPGDNPFVAGAYYRGLVENDIRKLINVEDVFSAYKFEVGNYGMDLYFWGLKK